MGYTATGDATVRGSNECSVFAALDIERFHAIMQRNDPNGDVQAEFSRLKGTDVVTKILDYSRHEVHEDTIETNAEGVEERVLHCWFGDKWREEIVDASMAYLAACGFTITSSYTGEDGNEWELESKDNELMVYDHTSLRSEDLMKLENLKKQAGELKEKLASSENTEESLALVNEFLDLVGTEVSP